MTIPGKIFYALVHDITIYTRITIKQTLFDYEKEFEPNASSLNESLKFIKKKKTNSGRLNKINNTYLFVYRFIIPHSRRFQ